MNAIEQARQKLAAQRFDGVDIAALLFSHREQPVVQLRDRLRIIRLEDHDAGSRVSALSGRCASMTLRAREVLDGFTADEIVLQTALDDEVDSLRRYALVVHFKRADQRFSCKRLA